MAIKNNDEYRFKYRFQPHNLSSSADEVYSVAIETAPLSSHKPKYRELSHQKFISGAICDLFPRSAKNVHKP